MTRYNLYGFKPKKHAPPQRPFALNLVGRAPQICLQFCICFFVSICSHFTKSEAKKAVKELD